MLFLPLFLEKHFKIIGQYPPYSKPKGQVNSLDIQYVTARVIFNFVLLACPVWCSCYIKTFFFFSCSEYCMMGNCSTHKCIHLNYYTWPHKGTFRLDLPAGLIRFCPVLTNFGHCWVLLIFIKLTNSLYSFPQDFPMRTWCLEYFFFLLSLQKLNCPSCDQVWMCMFVGPVCSFP